MGVPGYFYPISLLSSTRGFHLPCQNSRSNSCHCNYIRASGNRRGVWKYAPFFWERDTEIFHSSSSWMKSTFSPSTKEVWKPDSSGQLCAQLKYRSTIIQGSNENGYWGTIGSLFHSTAAVMESSFFCMTETSDSHISLAGETAGNHGPNMNMSCSISECFKNVIHGILVPQNKLKTSMVLGSNKFGKYCNSIISWRCVDSFSFYRLWESSLTVFNPVFPKLIWLKTFLHEPKIPQH